MGNALAILQMINQGMLLGAESWAIIDNATGPDLTDEQRDMIIARRKDVVADSRTRDSQPE